jgi:hypothetical protein
LASSTIPRTIIVIEDSPSHPSSSPSSSASSSSSSSRSAQLVPGPLTWNSFRALPSSQGWNAVHIPLIRLPPSAQELINSFKVVLSPFSPSSHVLCLLFFLFWFS